jgi:hypothetical protein
MSLKNFNIAVQILKEGVEVICVNQVTTEEEFNNNVFWVTGSDENDNAITTNICPHSEITWDKVKTEMDKL